jgi:hypothetical protein
MSELRSDVLEQEGERIREALAGLNELPLRRPPPPDPREMGLAEFAALDWEGEHSPRRQPTATPTPAQPATPARLVEPPVGDFFAGFGEPETPGPPTPPRPMPAARPLERPAGGARREPEPPRTADTADGVFSGFQWE